jgi:hypothetical protein
MARRTFHRIVGWVGFLALLVLHLDFWRGQRTVLYFGWLPEEVAYRLGWMALAFAYLLYYCARLWPISRDEERLP